MPAYQSMNQANDLSYESRLSCAALRRIRLGAEALLSSWYRFGHIIQLLYWVCSGSFDAEDGDISEYSPYVAHQVYVA